MVHLVKAHENTTILLVFKKNKINILETTITKTVYSRLERGGLRFYLKNGAELNKLGLYFFSNNQFSNQNNLT